MKKRSRTFTIFTLVLLAFLSIWQSPMAKEKGIEWKYRPGEGQLILVENLKRLGVLSHAHVPKAIFVALISQNYLHPSNNEFALNLYKVIYDINKRDGLLQANQGERQKIDFVVTGDQQRMDELVEGIRREITDEDAFSYFVPLVLKSGVLYDRWFQDWGEFVGVGESEEGELVYGVYYVNRNRGLKEIVKEISRMLGVPFISSDSYSGVSGNYGGNIETTPDGILYYGNTMRGPQIAQLRDLGNRDRMISLRTDWLEVGHVDEMMTTIPSTHTCRYPNRYKGPQVPYSHILADPILGLQLIYNYRGSQKYIAYSSNESLESRYNFVSLRKAISYFLKDPEKQVFTLRDFNSKSKSCHRDRRLATKYCDLVEFNIWAKKVLESNMKKLTKATPCINDDIIRIPQIYRSFPTAFGKKSLSFLPGTANMVVLRNNVIVPDPTFNGPGGFAPFIQDALDEKLKIGHGDSRVYFIDVKREYHDLAGEVHCGTNVMREPTLIDFSYFDSNRF